MSSNNFACGQDPFSLKPESKYFYQSPAGESLYRQLTKQIGKSRGVLMVTGEAGIGKTFLISEICRELDSQVRFFQPHSGDISFQEIVSQLIDYLGLKTESKDCSGHLELLTDYLSGSDQKNTRIALIFDDAHQLQDDVLTKLLSISFLADENGGSLQIILSGLPELDTRVFQLELPAVADKQVKIFCCTLERLKSSEIRGFIKHRLMSIGYHKHNLFTPDAISRLAKYSNGTPRLLIKICGSALSKTFLEDKNTVTAAIVDRVAADYLLRPAGIEEEGQFAGISGGMLSGFIDRFLRGDFTRSLVWAMGLVAIMVLGGLVYQLSGVGSGLKPTQAELAMSETPRAVEAELSQVAPSPSAADDPPGPVDDMASLSGSQSELSPAPESVPEPVRQRPGQVASGQPLTVAVQQPAPSVVAEPAQAAAEPVAAAQPGDNARRLIGELESPARATELDVLYWQAGRLGQQGQSTDAYLLYFYAARQGHGEAAFKLAQLADPATFEPGDGMLDTPNLAQANKWYQHALAAGHGQARQALSRLHAQVARQAARGDEPARRLMLQLDETPNAQP